MSRRWRAGLCVASLCAALYGVAGVGVATADTDAVRQRAVATRPAAPRDVRATADFRASLIRTGIATAGLAVFAFGWWTRGSATRRATRTRAALLVALAIASYAAYYQFFRLVHPDGFANPDNFHYYVGSKYFPELGYYGLYECSITALAERGVRVPGGSHPEVRDLRSMELWPAGLVRQRGANCPARFSPERWAAFARDVGFFVEKWPPHIRNAVWSDHGYHPTPVWTLVGGSVAGLAPTESKTAMRALLRTDRVLIALTLVAVTWAFGLEVGCLAAILWGTGHLWRYTWVGDAYLRHLWWIATFAGLCALRRDAPGVGGAGLATAAALRVFPGAFGVGYLAGVARRARQGHAVTPSLRRFVAGGAVAGALLLGLSLWAVGQGVAPIAEFAAKIGEFASVAATNKMGLGVLASRLFPDAPSAALMLRAVVGIGFAALFWRALEDALPWEAAALGFALIPFVTDPTNYYFSFFVMGAPLAARRPLVGVILLATGVAWGINGLVLYRSYAEFPAASVIATLSAAAVVWAMGRPPPRESGATHEPSRAATTAPAST